MNTKLRMRWGALTIAGTIMCALGACGGGGDGGTSAGASSTAGNVPASSATTPPAQGSVPGATQTNALPDIAGAWELAVVPPAAPTRPPAPVPHLQVHADGTFALDVQGYLWNGADLASQKRYACRFSGRFETQPQYDTRLHGRNLVIDDKGGDTPCPRDFINTALGDAYAPDMLRLALGATSAYDVPTAWFQANPDGTTKANFAFTLKRVAK